MESHNTVPGISWQNLIGKVTVADKITRECLTRMLAAPHYLVEEGNANS